VPGRQGPHFQDRSRPGYIVAEDLAELLTERGIHVDHSTVWRWVQRYGQELDLRQRRHLKLTTRSWRVDEMYVPVQGRWCYLYRAVDSEGATVEYFMSAFQDVEAANGLFRRALWTIQGYEAMHMLRKGQVRWVAGTDVRAQVRFIHRLFGIAV
jgi:IS6 family transposase